MSEQTNIPAATFRYTLTAESGYTAGGEARITPEQYGRIMAVLSGGAPKPLSPLSAPIEELYAFGLSVFERNCLVEEGITTVMRLLGQSDNRVFIVPRFSKKNAARVWDVLSRYIDSTKEAPTGEPIQEAKEGSE